MTKFIEVTGKTVDDAVKAGLAQLGLTAEQVETEVIEKGKSGFLGIGAVEAKVKLTYNVKETASEITERFLTGLLQKMDIEADIQMEDGEDGTLNVTLSGEKAGDFIGRRGETLDAIQHLTNYCLNHNGEKTKVHIDAENYRQRRNETLEKLARKMAQKALKQKRSVTLEPMNAYERHVIHATLQDYNGVTTFSRGTEPNRRVVIAVEGGKSSYGKSGKGKKNYSKPASSAEAPAAKESSYADDTPFIDTHEDEFVTPYQTTAQTTQTTYKEWK